MPITKEYITLSIDDIIPYENNPRINDDAVAGVVESIKQCGELDPIEVDENNVILSGHTRLRAYEQLKYKQVSVLKITGLTEPQKRKYRLLTNKTGEVAAWDFDKLELELDGLDFDGFDFGFDVDLPSLEEDDQKEVVEDDYDEEPPAEPKAKLGDIYQLGRHRLICGDSTDPAVIDRLMDGVKADMVLTDPPYGIDVVGENGTIGKENKAKAGVYSKIIGDETTDTAKRFFEICKTKSDKQILWGGNYFTDFLPFSDGWIIWDKRVDSPSNNFADGEMGWCSFHTRVRIYHHLWMGMIQEGEREKRVHPTQKPVKMIAEVLNDFTKENENILDGFGGSGSTLIACEQLNRKCYMAELDPKYVSVIVNRWLNLTGRKDEIFCIRDGQKLTYDEVFN